MIVYNLTVNIEQCVEDLWKEWIKGIYIPKVLGTGFFNSVKMFRLLEAENSDERTYSIQFITDQLEKVEKFLETEAPILAAEHQHRFQHRHVAFRSVLQEEKL